MVEDMNTIRLGIVDYETVNHFVNFQSFDLNRISIHTGSLSKEYIIRDCC